MSQESCASAEPPGCARTAARTEPPTAAAELFVLRFPLDPSADTWTAPGSVVTVIALELAGLVLLALVILAAQRRRRRDRDAGCYSRSVISSPS